MGTVSRMIDAALAGDLGYVVMAAQGEPDPLIVGRGMVLACEILTQHDPDAAVGWQHMVDTAISEWLRIQGDVLIDVSGYRHHAQALWLPPTDQSDEDQWAWRDANHMLRAAETIWPRCVAGKIESRCRRVQVSAATGRALTLLTFAPATANGEIDALTYCPDPLARRLAQLAVY